MYCVHWIVVLKYHSYHIYIFVRVCVFVSLFYSSFCVFVLIYSWPYDCSSSYPLFSSFQGFVLFRLLNFVFFCHSTLHPYSVWVSDSSTIVASDWLVSRCTVLHRSFSHDMNISMWSVKEPGTYMSSLRWIRYRIVCLI